MKTDIIRPILKKLNQLLSRKQKVYFLIIFILTLFLSFIETIGISIIMPFISIASTPDLINGQWYKALFDFWRFTSKMNFIIAFGVAIICFYVFRSVYNVAYTYILTKFSMGMFRHFSSTLFKTYLNIPYRIFVQRNSAELLQIVGNEANNSGNLLLNVLQILSESFTIVFLYGFMLTVNWRMTLVLTGILIIAVWFILRVLIRKSKKQGEKRAYAQRLMNRILGETFGNFKFIKLKGNENHLFKDFDIATKTISKAQTISSTLGALPKNILETVGFSLLIAAILFILWHYHTPENIIPIISMYALGLYRILPSINRMLGNINNVAFLQRSLDIVYDNVHQATECEGSESIVFEKSIRAKVVSFKYLTGAEVLTDVSLEIRKGEKIAITGESGGGKSTLADLLIGINKPSSGNICIDNVSITNENIRSWRSKIGYIPQSVYLFDGTVAENVAFGSEKNEKRIICVLEMANIWNFLEKKNGIHTLVGEGGIQLSGGQKQRVGIARALYCDPEVLVLDEATSALDNETENKIMEEIYRASESKTLIVIAHRLSTIKNCERQIKIENGKIVS
ncbi:ABC transporter ATP-binding protein/permease [Treponema endosymbiont of Eucomonympha sp.]|uniref:ABC transporter ATP-binding protein/permease n=1 Tax=Treponema endosymbiont of Eucomonympha sp. TaxID=1580831 RepID=UPI0007512D58|nr:ABC transporter ATP-binding protein [Treponema endosymbiont of Eucomonympha sp.]